MNKIRGFTYIIPYMLLCGLIFSGCGGGESYTETAQPIVVAADCLACHGTDIADTHYDVATTTKQLEGYVLDSAVSWALDMGYVLRTGAGACSASCHNYHSGDMSINREWYKSGHADETAGAFIYSFSASNNKCLRCHSGIGFASYVDSSNGTFPNWETAPPAIAAELKTHHITCNACHDATGYPSASNKRLRKTGSVILTNSTNYSQEETLNVGNSASCLICHQGTESGESLYDTMVSKDCTPYNVTDQTLYGSNSAVSSHYYQAGAMLYSVKGYEFKYINGTLNPNKYSKTSEMAHQNTNCTGCHMASSSDENFGGHTFMVNISICQVCHPGMTDFTDFVDYQNNIEQLKTDLINTLQSQGIYYYPAGSRGKYFFTSLPPVSSPSNERKTWRESQFEAAYNLLFVDKEPAAYIHNYKYAAQLLWDSCTALGGTPSVGRPSGDRTAKDYSL